MPEQAKSAAGLALTSFAVAAAAAALENAWRPPPSADAAPAPERRAAAKRLNGAAALLAGAALADSATEHYRGAFHNKIMVLPLGVAAQALGASLHGAAARGHRASSARGLGHALALVTGIVGTGFHLYNLLKRPGGWSWLNLFYAAPLGAPVALSLSGMLGGLAERLRAGRSLFGRLPGRLVARLAALGLVGASGEAALFHFRGAYHNPAMVIPVTVPPVAAALLLAATLSPRWTGAARGALRLLTGIGVAGAAFHAYGISRNMGGWRNWSQNLLNGPPLPAPPAFTALALAGLAALKLIERER